MCTTLISSAQWAQQEFGFVSLGDLRRNKRLVKIGTRLGATPGGTLPQAFAAWAELKAAYRFFGQTGVSYERIISGHLERTREACRQPGEYLLIEDATLLDYSSHPMAEDLGLIGEGGRGFEVHTNLAVRVEGWTLEQKPEGTVVGLFDQQCYRPGRAPQGESRRQLLSRPRKSQHWAASLQWAGRPPQGSQWIYLADREADCCETIQRCQTHGVDFIIRACHNRRLDGALEHVREAVAQRPLLGRTTVSLRSRGGQPARTAMVELRSVQVDLHGTWRPGGGREPLRNIGVIEVKEVEGPDGVEPLHWILLTSLPNETLAQVRRIVGRYTGRWWVEEYHKALKSGAGAEDSQLEQGGKIAALTAVLAVVAVRLLSTKFLARSRPDSFEAAENIGPEIVSLIEKKMGKPKKGWTNQNLLVAIARLGGFLARKHDGMPGWQTIWRGWQRLIWMAEGVEILMGG